MFQRTLSKSQNTDINVLSTPRSLQQKCERCTHRITTLGHHCQHLYELLGNECHKQYPPQTKLQAQYVDNDFVISPHNKERISGNLQPPQQDVFQYNIHKGNRDKQCTTVPEHLNHKKKMTVGFCTQSAKNLHNSTFI